MARKLSARIESPLEPLHHWAITYSAVARTKQQSRWEVRTAAQRRVRAAWQTRHLRDKVPVICTGSKRKLFSMEIALSERCDSSLWHAPFGRATEPNRTGHDEEFSNFVLVYCATNIGKNWEIRNISLLQCLHFVQCILLLLLAAINHILRCTHSKDDGALRPSCLDWTHDQRDASRLNIPHSASDVDRRPSRLRRGD